MRRIPDEIRVEHFKRSKRNSSLKARYGITLNQYEEMLSKQKNLCALCFHSSKRTLHVDHCHKTGRVRRLLCSSCNLTLSKVDRDMQILGRLALYKSTDRQNYIDIYFR